MRKISDGKTAKQRYFDKLYNDAPLISCACGCGEQIKSKDKYGRNKKYISGHNTPQKYEGDAKARRNQTSKAWNRAHREERYQAKATRHRRKKVDCIIYKGGQCTDCGLKYNGKNACVFHMHHRDPGSKDFAIGNQVVNKAWSRIVEELDKCDLLCANCHEMRHSIEF